MNADFLPEKSYFIKWHFKMYSMSLPELDTRTSINLMGAKIG